MKKPVFEGVCTALVTPFDDAGNIDYVSTKKLLKFQVDNKVDAILILGSTGESFALSENERKAFITFVRANLPRTIKLIVGAGSNLSAKAIQMIDEAALLGADACLVQTPYYCKCTQNGLLSHFQKICENSKLPIIVYNIPSRAGVNIQPKTMQKLCEFEKIVGLKEANGDMEHVLSMAHTLKNEVAFYCGNDNLFQLFLSLNCNGVISVTSNVFPKEIGQMWKNREKSLQFHENFFEFNNLMFCEPNPIPVKYALSKVGIISNNLRPPLTKLETQHEKPIDEQLNAWRLSYENSADRLKWENGQSNAKTPTKEKH